jgi:hypothetical protein
MTILPTHLSLGGIILWSILNKNEKEGFSKNKFLFWVVLAFSIFPDIDIFIGLHRGFWHSLIPPSIMAIVGVHIHTYYQQKIKSTNDELKQKLAEKAFWGRCAFYAGLLWITHIMLDWEYPLALFYPLSDRLYQIDFVYLLNLTPWLFFPVMIVGAQLKITSVSYLQGIASYFINLSPSERIEAFGTDVITIRIEDFLIHVILFAFFLIYVGKPMIPSYSNEKLLSIYRNLHYERYVLSAGLLLVIIGLIMGPMIGDQVIDKDSVNSTLRISSGNFAPSLAISIDPPSYLLQPQTTMKISGSLTIQSNESSFAHVLLVTKQNSYSNFVSGISALFKVAPPNTSDNLMIFKSGYNNLLSMLYSDALAMNLTNLNETYIDTELEINSVALVAVIENWNDTSILEGIEQQMGVKLTIIVRFSRITVYLIGLGTIIVGILVIFISVNLKKKDNQ